MDLNEIKSLVIQQKNFFKSGKTLDIKFRKEVLKKIETLILKYREKFVLAMKQDLNKCEFEFYSNELLIVLNEIRFMYKNISKLSRPTRVKTSLTTFPSKAKIFKQPYGVSVVIAPWNYPFQLALVPLIDAIASGNTCILKPAYLTDNVSNVLKTMFYELNMPELVTVVLGDKDETNAILEQDIDFIFFTGGEKVAKIINAKVAEKLIPCVYELGGKSPCIILDDADLDIACKRIAWGKFVNAGQTCVAPDYVLVPNSLHDSFVNKLNKYILKFYYKDGKLQDYFCKIVSQNRLDHLNALISNEKIIFGGKSEGLILEPTVIDNVNFMSKIMQEEIFGPILPIITYNNIEDILKFLMDKPHPLAFYVFSKSKKKANEIFIRMSFGGGSFNECVMHLTEENLPFGGIGNSGLGSYHGKKGFETFTHEKSILYKKKMELNAKYPPYNEKKINFIKKFGKIK